MARKDEQKENIETQDKQSRLVAVIDMGATSVRMVVAEINPDGSVRPLDFLQQPVSLGKDTFTNRRIERTTTEACVSALRSFRHMLDEYRITDPANIRAVATSAVREARNRQAFLDRLYIATGIEVEAIDEAEGSRCTFHSIEPLIRADKKLRSSNVLIAEVGGGSTEVLCLSKGQLDYSHTYRLGSLRLRQKLEDFRAPLMRVVEIMESQIQATVRIITQQIDKEKTPHMMALGGDARFAAAHICPKWDGTGVVRIKTADLATFTQHILNLSVDELVRRYHLTYPSAETLGPALLTYLRLAENFDIDRIVVASSTLRDGLLAEMASAHGVWTDDFSRQIIHSALKLGRKYDFDQKHAEHIAYLCGELYEALREKHQLSSRYGLILHVAALLHEIGRFISERSHHKHSMYIILNSELFGLGSRDLKLAALVARYHRRAIPRPTHEVYSQLDRESRIAVAKLAAILRVADALEAEHSQRIRKIEVSVENKEVTIRTRSVLDLSLEKAAMQSKSQMFEQVYGKPVVLKTTRASR
jgi:exopolyphosphatase/guanosine-5'-triphosphate,3'-diphosphate pyrophosphatase